MSLSPVQIEILWKRLVTAVDEAATTLVRTSFSSVIRDFHDYACAIFDSRGRMLAQSTHSTPGLLGILPGTMPNFLALVPAERLAPGDVLVTNDPWLASGHMIDVTLATPIFRHGRIAGYVLCVVHHLNMGGRLASLESRDLYEEGLRIPVTWLHRGGEEQAVVFEFIRANVRQADKVVGDIRAQVAANHAAEMKAVQIMDAAGLDGLDGLGDEIIARSERSMRAAIAQVPRGEYGHEMVLREVAGYPEEVRLRLLATVSGDDIRLDFAGTSPQIPRAVNVTLNFTRSYAVYPLKCILNPDVPNNEGALRPIEVVAPEGSILNARFPAATWGRTAIAHLLPELIMQALANAVPERLLAASGSTPLWYLNFTGRHLSSGPFFSVVSFHGGLGARARRDGISCISYPANVASIPLEVIESEAPILFERKALATDSVGHGRTRGGFGQHVVVRVPEDANDVAMPIHASVRGGRFGEPVRGVFGGGDAPGPVLQLNGKDMPLTAQMEMRAGDRLSLVVPGGAGYGDPRERAPARIAADIADGLVTPDVARQVFGYEGDVKDSSAKGGKP